MKARNAVVVVLVGVVTAAGLYGLLRGAAAYLDLVAGPED